MADLLVLRKACRMAPVFAENLEDAGPAEKKSLASVPQSEQLARPPLPKEKGTEPSVQMMRWERVKTRKRMITAKA